MPEQKPPFVTRPTSDTLYVWPGPQGYEMYAALAVVGRAIPMTVATNRNGSVVLKNFEVENIAISPSYDDRESGIAQKVFGEPTPSGVSQLGETDEELAMAKRAMNYGRIESIR